MTDFPTISPRRAAVVPRASVYPTGEPLPLEHHIQTLLNENCRLAVNLYGPRGSGKTTALNHLATLFPFDKVTLLDQFPDLDFIEQPHDKLILFTSESRASSATIALELAPWHEDDLIEYLLHTHRDKCKSVVQRVTTADHGGAMPPLPELWTVVLDQFAADEALDDIAAAFQRHLEGRLGDRYHEACSHCLQSALAERKQRPVPAPLWNVHEKLLRHSLPLSVLAAQRLAAEISAGNFTSLRYHISRDVLGQVTRYFPPPYEGLRGLAEQLEADHLLQSTGVSLLLAADPAWRPKRNRLQSLGMTHAPGALWKGVQFFEATLISANLSRADLTQANLQLAEAGKANFRQARMVEADLRQAKCSGSDFSRADLTGARCQSAVFERTQFEQAILVRTIFDHAELYEAAFEGANLMHASFSRASLQQVKLDGANLSYANFSQSQMKDIDFREATLAGTYFFGAKLARCNLEEINFPLADFEDADLSSSYFTASSMPGANFRNACLRSTGLAEVQWENADLRGADFRGATFHMGSSRSGLVNSPIASEGTRTGFYTDDYNDQDYKPPEEIRKANLCGCDLRDANIEGTDFYLVDLRRAKYSKEQGRHFARCGAILRSRCE